MRAGAVHRQELGGGRVVVARPQVLEAALGIRVLAGVAEGGDRRAAGHGARAVGVVAVARYGGAGGGGPHGRVGDFRRIKGSSINRRPTLHPVLDLV